MNILKLWKDFSKKFDAEYDQFMNDFAAETEKDAELENIYKLAEKDKGAWNAFVIRAFQRWKAGYDLGSVISCELMKQKFDR